MLSFQDELGEENENNAERQTILVGNNTYKVSSYSCCMTQIYPYLNK
mgnify:CR=1 FL=1